MLSKIVPFLEKCDKFGDTMFVGKCIRPSDMNHVFSEILTFACICSFLFGYGVLKKWKSLN